VATSPTTAPISNASPQASAPAGTTPAQFQLGTLEGACNSSQQVSIRVEFGHTQLAKPRAEKLLAGSVVKLEQLDDQPVDIWADGVRIAQAELVVIEGKLCARICMLLKQDANSQSGHSI
jgi:flagellar motor switch/type III secretory pathway protein FliN